MNIGRHLDFTLCLISEDGLYTYLGYDDVLVEGEKVVAEESVSPKKPSQYSVIILNDDYTPMEFVVHVLQRFFQMAESEATQVMLEIHNKGSAQAGIYPKDIAETKSYQVNHYAQKNKYPLLSKVNMVDEG